LWKIIKELSLNYNQGSVIILNSELGADGMYFVILKAGFDVKFTKSVLLK
jgi:hypothetical protein